jgi:4,5-dihydroxyphthalate decarboxylase
MDRRTVLKLIGAAASGATSIATSYQAYGASKSNLSIRLAGYDYDRVMGFINGNIEIKGCDYTFEVDTIGSLNTDALGGPMTREVTEVGMAPYILAFANDGLQKHTLIPVFPLRVFRHKSIFIRPDRGIKKPEDLRGKKVATPGYSSTSLTWIRGLMQEPYGVSPKDIHWVVARKDSSSKDTGGASRFEGIVPSGLTITEGPEGKDESDLLVSGEVDALFHAAEPRAFIEGNPNCVRLFSDSRAVEQAYYQKTGIFPIMHAIAIRNDVIEAHPWLPQAVFQAYSEAKQQVYDFQRKHAWFKTTQPWISQELEQTREIMGNNFYSYGFTKNNRSALNALFRYCHDQGLANRVVTIEELFHPSTLELKEFTV